MPALKSNARRGHCWTKSPHNTSDKANRKPAIVRAFLWGFTLSKVIAYNRIRRRASRLNLTTEKIDMIELRTNTDFLDRLAAEETQAGRDGNGTDIKAAALDHRNLQEYAERLESNIQNMSGEIQSIRTQRDEAAAALLAIFRPELERMIDAAIEQCRPLEDLRERVERLEDDDDKANDIREEVRDMIRDGELVVELKNANSW
jgi:hypothetical protein